MVTNKKNVSVLRDGKAALLAFTPAFLMAAASAYVPMEAGLVMPVFACLITMVIGGLVILWRQADAARNSTLMVGLHMISQKEILGKSCSEIREMLIAEKGKYYQLYTGAFELE